MFDVVSQTVTDIKSYVFDLYYFYWFLEISLLTRTIIMTSYNVDHKILTDFYAWRKLSDVLKTNLCT